MRRERIANHGKKAAAGRSTSVPRSDARIHVRRGGRTSAANADAHAYAIVNAGAAAARTRMRSATERCTEATSATATGSPSGRARRTE